MNNTTKTEIREFFMPRGFGQLLANMLISVSILTGLSFIVNISWTLRFEIEPNPITVAEDCIYLAVLGFMVLAYLVQLIIKIKKHYVDIKTDKYGEA